jgi:hypothetical protein
MAIVRLFEKQYGGEADGRPVGPNLTPDPDSPHIHLLDRYMSLRPLLRDMHSEAFRQMSRRGIRQAAEALGMWRDNTLYFDNESNMDVFWEYCLYQHFHDGQNGVQRYTRASRFAPGSDKALLAAAMTNARYRLMEIESLEKGVGITVRDILRHDRFFIMDRNFGSTATAGAVISGTILGLSEFSMTTGGVVPLRGGWKKVVREVCGVALDGDALRATLSRDMEKTLAQHLVRLALDSGWTESVQYL